MAKRSIADNVADRISEEAKSTGLRLTNPNMFNASLLARIDYAYYALHIIMNSLHEVLASTRCHVSSMTKPGTDIRQFGQTASIDTGVARLKEVARKRVVRRDFGPKNVKTERKSRKGLSRIDLLKHLVTERHISDGALA